MPVERSQLDCLAQGQLREIFVGNLPTAVAATLKCHPGTVYLGRDEYYHIQKEHGAIITPGIVQLIPAALQHGRFYLEAERPKSLVAFYRNRYENRLYLLAMKRCANGGEVWVSTFYCISDKKAASKLKRYMLIYSGN